MSLRLWTPLFAFALALVVGCGGASGTDFDAGDGDGSAGEPAGGGSGQGGSAQGGSSSGSGGSTEGGTTSNGGSPTGGSPTGGSPTGGASGTGTGGVTGGSSGTGSGGADPIGGTGGSPAGSGGAGGVSGRAGSGGQAGSDCNLTIQRARTALASAQLCNPLAGNMVCTGTVEDLCGCQVPVNDANSEATKNYLELREPAVKCGVACLAIPCMEPTTPMCGIAAEVSGIVAATSCRWSPR